MSKLSLPNPKALAEIMKLLEMACADQIKREAAFEAIKEAIQQYRDFSHPVVDGAYRDHESTLTATRNQLKSIQKMLVSTLSSLQSMNLDGQRLLIDALSADRVDHESNPLARAKARILELENAAKAALEVAAALPNKEPDHFKTVMARDIAKALEDAGIKVTKTVPKPNEPGRHLGGNYANILCHAFEAAGTGSVNLKSYVQSGIDLLRDPDANP